MRKAIKNLETKTFESLNDLTKQLSAYYTKTKPEKIQAIQAGIAKIQKYKKKWDGKQPPESGPKKIIYDQDMNILSSSEV